MGIGYALGKSHGHVGERPGLRNLLERRAKLLDVLQVPIQRLLAEAGCGLEMSSFVELHRRPLT